MIKCSNDVDTPKTCSYTPRDNLISDAIIPVPHNAMIYKPLAVFPYEWKFNKNANKI